MKFFAFCVIAAVALALVLAASWASSKVIDDCVLQGNSRAYCLMTLKWQMAKVTWQF